MLHIKKILNRNIAASGISKGVESARIVEVVSAAVQNIFPSEIAQKIHVSHVKERSVFITCNSAPIAQELSFYTDQILKKLDETLGVGRVKKIRINIG